MTILAPLAVTLGFILWQRYGIGKGMGWMHAKLLVVLLIALYHWYCAVLLKKIKAGKMHSHTWYRWFNEIPVVLLLAATLLVTVKPF
jgi:putative membrane protein